MHKIAANQSSSAHLLHQLVGLFVASKANISGQRWSNAQLPSIIPCQASLRLLAIKLPQLGQAFGKRTRAARHIVAEVTRCLRELQFPCGSERSTTLRDHRTLKDCTRILANLVGPMRMPS